MSEGETRRLVAVLFADAIGARADSHPCLQINAFDAERLTDVPDEELSVSERRTRAARAVYRGSMTSRGHASQLLDRGLELKPDDLMALATRVEAMVTTAAAAAAGIRRAGRQPRPERRARVNGPPASAPGRSSERAARAVFSRDG